MQCMMNCQPQNRKRRNRHFQFVESKIKAVSNIQGEAFLEEIMNITTYLEGNDPALHKAVTELGAWMRQGGNTLVYGGSKAD